VALYVLDTNIWIHIGRHHPKDPFVNFWKQLDASIAAKVICSPEDVLHELARGTDDLDKELKKKDGLFIPLDGPVMKAAGKIVDECKGFVDEEGDTNRADPFVVALAQVRSGIVVTRERPRKTPTGRPRIPDACGQFSVPWRDWFGFLREIGWQL
jgi:hypothetical protein